MSSSIKLILLISALFIAAPKLSAQGANSAVEILGDTAGDGFGSSISCLSDKLLVGVPGADSQAYNDVGEVRVYRNQGMVFETISYPFTEIGGELFGSAVAYSGDINGDGGNDIIIGAAGEGGTGAVHIFKSASDSNPFFFSNTADSGDKFGFSVLSIPDFTNDGLSEVAVGAPGTDAGIGAVKIFDINDTSKSDRIKYSFQGTANAVEEFGHALAYSKNLNSDRSPALIVGAPKNSSSKGRIYTYDLNSGSFSATFNAPSGATNFGHSIDTVSDVNADGLDEILVGAPVLSGTKRGKAYLISGSSVASGALNILCTLEETESGSKYGFSVKHLGDINGDGKSEFAIGTPNSAIIGDEAAASMQGGFYIYTFSEVSKTCEKIAAIGGFEEVGKESGISFAGGLQCDIYKDANTDFVVGTKSDDPGKDAGSFVLYKGADFDLGPAPEDIEFKFRISRAGVFTATLDLDVDPEPRECKASILGRTQLGTKISQVFELGSDFLSSRENNAIISNVPKSAIVAGKKPIIHLIVQLDCNGGDRQYSNVFSRYMNCSKEGKLTTAEWITQFQALTKELDIVSAASFDASFSNKIRRTFDKLRGKKIKKSNV
ncbi:MAG: integrin alpha [Bdellovibrionota bacterium]